MSWTFYLASLGFFTVLFGVFYAVCYSVLLGVYENYLRHYQKANLQWTGPESRFPRRKIRYFRLMTASVLTAWLVVHFLVMP